MLDTDSYYASNKNIPIQISFQNGILFAKSFSMPNFTYIILLGNLYQFCLVCLQLLKKYYRFYLADEIVIIITSLKASLMLVVITSWCFWQVQLTFPVSFLCLILSSSSCNKVTEYYWNDQNLLNLAAH